MIWLQFILVFIFGYATCQTFYFLKATRTSITVIKSAQLLSLAVLAKSMENFAYARTFKILVMSEGGASEQNIESFLIRSDEEINSYKDRAINYIIDSHSRFFKELIDFNDWQSAMAVLDANGSLVQEFFKKDETV